MRGHGLSGPFRAPCFDDDNRFSQSDLAGCREKRSGIPNRLHVNQNALRVKIIGQIVDEVSPADVQH